MNNTCPPDYWKDRAAKAAADEKELRAALALAYEVVSNEKYMIPTDARLILAHAYIAIYMQVKSAG